MKHNDNTKTRREFVRQTALAVGGAGLLAATSKLYAAPPPPSQRAIQVAGTHAYADRLSVEAGEEINFQVSSDTPYTMQIYRLGLDPDTPDSDTSMSGVFSFDRPSQQPIHPGSYVYVKNALPPKTSLTALTLECWVRPFVGRPTFSDTDFNYTGLITQFDYTNGAGFGLFVRFPLSAPNGGHVAFYLGDGGAYNPANLLDIPFDFLGTIQNWEDLQWHHIVATWNGSITALWIDGVKLISSTFTGTVRPGPAPLRLAALGANGEASHFLNGDLAMPVIYNRALSDAEIGNRYAQKDAPTGVQTPPLNGVLACWPLTEEVGGSVADISPFRRSGSIINHATWQIGGPSFKAGDVHEFDIYDPAKDLKRGHGLRFCSDDLFDCGWKTTMSYQVPVNARSGIYAARLSYFDTFENRQVLYHVTFIVRKPDNQAAAPILLVCPTNTWLAYNSRPFLRKVHQAVNDSLGRGFKETYETNRRAVDSGDDVPECSCYLGHQNFAPPYHFGRLLPQPGADPYVTYHTDDYSHLTRATRFTQVWLENIWLQKGYAYDVISDLDLHSIPGILNGYRTVILAGHSEYWSIQAYNSVKSYLAGGGKLIVLSGNTMYWRVSFDPTGTVMECRKADGAGAEIPSSRRGEAWHSDDGLRGGLMRQCGFPGWQVCGLETFGILGSAPGSPGNVGFATFNVNDPAHFLFQGTGVTTGQPFATNMVGHESDVGVYTLETLRIDSGNGVPAGATPPLGDPPVAPAGMTTLAQATGGDVQFNGLSEDYFLQSVQPAAVKSVADMIYWDRPDGGHVFNGGAIGNGIALLNDDIFATVVYNALLNFL
jgi:hypothetical protein